MTNALQEFVNTLPVEIQEQVNGHKNIKVIAVLQENDIEIPQDILDFIEERERFLSQHDTLMDSMRCFMGRKLSDTQCEIKL